MSYRLMSVRPSASCVQRCSASAAYGRGRPLYVRMNRPSGIHSIRRFKSTQSGNPANQRRRADAPGSISSQIEQIARVRESLAQKSGGGSGSSQPRHRSFLSGQGNSSKDDTNKGSNPNAAANDQFSRTLSRLENSHTKNTGKHVGGPRLNNNNNNNSNNTRFGTRFGNNNSNNNSNNGNQASQSFAFNFQNNNSNNNNGNKNNNSNNKNKPSEESQRSATQLIRNLFQEGSFGQDKNTGDDLRREHALSATRLSLSNKYGNNSNHSHGSKQRAPMNNAWLEQLRSGSSPPTASSNMFKDMNSDKSQNKVTQNLTASLRQVLKLTPANNSFGQHPRGGMNRWQNEEENAEDQLPDLSGDEREFSREHIQEATASMHEETIVGVRTSGVNRVILSDTQTVEVLAQRCGMTMEKVVDVLQYLGEVPDSLDDNVPLDVAELVLEELDIPFIVASDNQFDEEVGQMSDLGETDAPERPPVVCVLGHVDHGKTTMLDTLRKTNVAAKEAGRITQSMGAFAVSTEHGRMTFIDTPGHAVFSNMRRRGAGVTDVAVLVVSATDSVQPQTVEAANLALQSQVPMVVAINKCDMPGADPDAVRAALMDIGVMVEELGGDILDVEVSALKGTGMEDLCEAIALTAEMQNLTARTDGRAQCYVVESAVVRGRGMVVQALVRRGTLKVGDFVVSGRSWGRVKSLMNCQGKAVKEATPSTPVGISGFKNIDELDAEVIVVDSEDSARRLVEARQRRTEMSVSGLAGTRLEDADDLDEDGDGSSIINMRTSWKPRKYRNGQEAVMATRQEEEMHKLEAQRDLEQSTVHMVVKADVSGSLDAFLSYLNMLPSDEARVKIVRTGLGPVSEEDVEYARDTEAMVIGFNVSAPGAAKRLAETHSVPMKTHKVIYHLMDKVVDELSSRMPGEEVTEQVGTATVQQVFKLNKSKQFKVPPTVAGLMVNKGLIRRENVEAIVSRNGSEVYRGPVTSLRVHKDEVPEVSKGNECGLILDGFPGSQPGDDIEFVETKQKQRRIDDSAARGHNVNDSHTAHNRK